MSDTRRILITGIQGLIGKILGDTLREKGYDVWGVDIEGDPANQILEVDLLSQDEAKSVIAGIKPFSVVIHTAALAHGQTPPAGKTAFEVNTEITHNLLAAVEDESPRIIFLSSASVYGEDGHKDAVRVSDKTLPATEYAQSKLACEELVRESALEHFDILRLAPIFDDSYMVNARKRVFFPGLPGIKMRLYPAPKHSMCSLVTVAEAVCSLLEQSQSGQRVRNVCDAQPYDQHQLAAWFPGPSIPLPVILLSPLYALLHLVPSNPGYALRCLFWKLFRSNVYSLDGDKE